MTTGELVPKLYRSVVEDVMNNVKEAFLDEGVDEQVLQELKELWEKKLASSKALEAPAPNQEVILAPQSMAMMLPQTLQTKSQEQGVLGQTTQLHVPAQFQISQAAATAALALQKGLFHQQIAALGTGGQLQNITVQQTGAGQYITLPGISSQSLPQLQQQHHLQQAQLTQNIAPHILQHQQIKLPQQQAKLIQAGQLLDQTTVVLQPHVRPQGAVHPNLIQIDGAADTSSSDDDDFDDDDREDDDKEEENEEDERGEEEDPLNSADDLSEEDPIELFDTENVVVCQYDKINRNKNKWKFHLKDGIMNLNGRDFVFHKATGDAEW